MIYRFTPPGYYVFAMPVDSAMSLRYTRRERARLTLARRYAPAVTRAVDDEMICHDAASARKMLLMHATLPLRRAARAPRAQCVLCCAPRICADTRASAIIVVCYELRHDYAYCRFTSC